MGKNFLIEVFLHFCYNASKSMGEAMRNCFEPGKIWLDTSGRRIQAHGGSIFYENKTYYWYGENKEHTDGKNGVWHWGVRCYSSKDLYNWQDEGLIIPPVLDDETSPLHPSAMMDRPHILYNESTKKYVCWLKIMGRDGSQTETVLSADNLLGPYTIVRTGLKPLGMSAGDFDLAKAPDGKGYYFFERVHSETIIADLTDDYTDVTGYYSTHFPHAGPPYVREATAHFTRKGRHYLITSGTTGYFPNPSEAAVADTWHGPYRVLGDPHIGDESRTSFHSQISSVFHVPNSDLYIALADRWLPDCTYRYEDYERAFARRFIEGKGPLQGEEKYFADTAANTSISEYVWLPIVFEGEKPVIKWYDSWKIEDFIKE